MINSSVLLFFNFSDIGFYSTKLSTVDLILLILYAVICIVIGLLSSRNQKDEDYMIAGRKLNMWGFVMSVVASYIGGAAIVAYSAYVYQFGISALAIFIGTAAGFLLFIPYALKLRKISSEKKFITLSDWFYYKFNKKIGLLSAIILFVVYFGMLLNQFIAGSSILSKISGWSYETALLVSSVVICIYLFAGGFRSVIKTDIFQYLVLFVLFIFLGFFFLTGKKDTALGLLDFSEMSISMTIAFIAFGIFIIFQSAEYWQRVYAAKNEKVVKKGFKISAILVVITGFAISIVGLTARGVSGLEAKDAFAQGLTMLLPQKFIGAGLVLIFAAIMSSADTIIFVLASSVSKDWFGRLMDEKQNKHEAMKQTRLFIVIFSLLGFTFAYSFRDLVAVIVFITGIGFTIVPATIASFHYKLKNSAVYASFISGLTYVILLVCVANFQAEPLAFFKDNADMSIASILVSFIFLVIFQKFGKENNNSEAI
ncbi:MAG: sodium:solute symporter family protein [Bacteroidales bacterium]|nr:sodium:solute symporter family protein [Bacteroidales bacterium]